MARPVVEARCERTLSPMDSSKDVEAIWSENRMSKKIEIYERLGFPKVLHSEGFFESI